MSHNQNTTSFNSTWLPNITLTDEEYRSTNEVSDLVFYILVPTLLFLTVLLCILKLLYNLEAIYERAYRHNPVDTISIDSGFIEHFTDSENEDEDDGLQYVGRHRRIIDFFRRNLLF